jgi:acetyl-CoA acetyltransferase
MMTMRGKVAVAGVGETKYYKHGQSPDPEFKLALEAVLNACKHAGINPREIDGFSSYSNDRSTSTRLAAALGLEDVGVSMMQWEGGGGGNAGAVANAAAAIHAGMAKCVVVLRSLAQGQFGRFGLLPVNTVSDWRAFEAPWGLMSPAQMFAAKMMRFMHDHGVRQETMRSVSLAAYHHAQNNPRAVMYGRTLDEEKYDNSRWIAEPFHLYDCCQENDGAAAMILVPAERARDLPNKPCYVLSGGTGIDYRSSAWAGNTPDYGSSNFNHLARRLYDMAKVGPGDVDVCQAYENFTGGVVMGMVEFGFCKPEEANEFFTKENLTVGGKLPINTSGGNLAECYMHGFGLLNEGARQIMGQSCNQVENANVVAMIGGPMVAPISACIFGSEDTL